jgi:predicted TIM-barrel fold metal-dependent hydrolase
MGGYGHAMLLSLGFPFETATAATRLILGGVLDRYPGLKIILAHGGGALPSLTGRIDACTGKDRRSSENMGRPFKDYLERFYFDAITYSSPVLAHLIQAVGYARVMFGTDHPFGIADPEKGRTVVADTLPSGTERNAILHDNAHGWIETGTLGHSQ